MKQDQIDIIQNALIEGTTTVCEIILDKNFDESDRLALIVDDRIISQRCLRMFASETAKLFMLEEKKEYRLVSTSILDLLQLIVEYEDDESKAWEILERQQNMVIASKSYNPHIATGIAHIAISLYITYMGIENYYEFNNYSNDDYANSNREHFIDEAYRDLLAILLECITLNLH